MKRALPQGHCAGDLGWAHGPTRQAGIILETLGWQIHPETIHRMKQQLRTRLAWSALLFWPTALLTQAQTIPNPSFEANHYTNYPGYASVNGGSISGWTLNPTNRVVCSNIWGISYGDDMSFRLPTTNIVTTSADNGAGSLRQLVAEAIDGDVIKFDPSRTQISPCWPPRTLPCH